MKKPRGVYILKTIFGGDVRLQRIEDVMTLVRQMTLAEMKAVIKEATQYHDSIVIALDPRWEK
jgi:hypothetical protein